ncbi:protein-methionine-sulfoxide reductase catalytic subunit MsrP [Neosynechococcus sphagnicola]|uniref:protein-methionine-sulfoxide reductase catalytic subunit MsrP n=1 Tax=Neosynechococcus sphagnicola TaxID=1501145 RepID=UPI000AE1E5EB|nr:protein-methionine-sulfoxide reductase catalytic subunit MsrP [Neosynechococcus sphagnicola]
MRPPWQLSTSQVTPEAVFWGRRRLLQGLMGASMVPLSACHQSPTAIKTAPNPQPLPLSAPRNPAFTSVDPSRPITNEILAAHYNNFYEFGRTKSIWQAAQALPSDPWQVEVSGLVKHPRTYDLDDLYKAFPLEERIYRFRCVEAWAMVVPWIGFPMRSLLTAVEPLPTAKFVRFTSFYDPKITLGPSWLFGEVPWPYREGLTIAEMANELAFFAVGIYGHRLPKQHGAPLRMVTPWKYGFKGAKSLVKIEFVDRQPATFWNTLVPEEYGFEANVNPSQPHPRWSQATERLIGPGEKFTWEQRPTLPYNGYGEYVASLYR